MTWRGPRGRHGSRRGRAARGFNGKPYREACAAAISIARGESSPMLADDFAGEVEAVAAAGGLCRKERLENAFEVPRRDPWAVVRDLQLDPVAVEVARGMA